MDKKLESEAENFFFFNICTLKESRLLGDVNLDLVNRYSREAFVGIMIGDRNEWNKGYGTDTLRVLLRYAFTELNLRRVSLTVNVVASDPDGDPIVSLAASPSPGSPPS